MLFKHLVLFVGFVAGALATNSTYLNPILPGFHPDPSCIFVPELDDTYFCASSSFLVFPGIRQSSPPLRLSNSNLSSNPRKPRPALLETYFQCPLSAFSTSRPQHNKTCHIRDLGFDTPLPRWHILRLHHTRLRRLPQERHEPFRQRCLHN